MSTPIPIYTPPTVPLRTKRNFKGAQLVADPVPSSPASSVPAALRIAPTVGARKRPPPLGGNAGPAPFPDFPAESPATSRTGTMPTLSSTLAKLDLSATTKFDLRDADLKKLAELGQGNGGSVVKVEHVPSGTIMAKKIVLIDAKSSVRKQIVRELEIMHECRSEYIISCFGSYLAEPNICICMEFMDKGSFDGIYKQIGAIDIEVVSKVALSVLEGLTYLYDVHRIIHRDIKPSNILCNSEGAIKLIDFGVSGELINSIANTFVGTSIYMSPERIQGAEYSVKSDVWSLGITLVELALGRFPFSDSFSDDDNLSDLDEEQESPGWVHNKTPTHRDSFAMNAKTANRLSKRKSKGVSLNGGGMTMSIIELMHQIVREPAPRLTPEGRFPKEAEDFVDACLLKDPDQRQTPKLLLTSAWMDMARASTFDLKAWTSTF